VSRGDAPGSADVALGILAGGRATRLAGLDKAWLERGGQPQVLRLARAFAGDVAGVLVSANRDAARYAAHALATVPDRYPGLGPIAGLDALAAACTMPWMLTLPVDLMDPGGKLLPSLRAEADADGAYAVDDDGPQPLVALWRVDALRAALAAALADGDHAVHGLQARLRMAAVRLPGVRFGNLNTPADLAAAGIRLPP
jgi:molybdopterin-guanine dinucleotide biosynthesis protein A